MGMKNIDGGISFISIGKVTLVPILGSEAAMRQ
jgi:hypothetical protein